MEDQNINANANLEQKESIELNLTAKGLYQWTIKVRETIISDATINRLAWLNDRLKTDYPNNVMKQNEAANK